MAAPPLIRCEKLDKWYSGVHALHGIDLDIHAGEIIGLIGDNGAGKSTLIKLLSGVHQPDSGAILVDGRKVHIRSPRDAMRLGIETIYQSNSMVLTMSIARNLFLGREPARIGVKGFGILDQGRMRSEARAAIARVDLEVRSPDARLGELSGGQRQGVAIARAMYFRSRVVILDEPTNHLSVKETAKVIDFIKGFKSQNVTGIFISHNLQHVFETCERLVVMARGEIVRDTAREETTISEVSGLL
ncbi:MAG: ATP-binding cassette domain-containing protein [Acetobacteraceae bacterium]